MKADKNARTHFLEELGLPPCASEAFEEQRRFRKGVWRQKVKVTGWIGALVFCSGMGILTARQFGFLSGSGGRGALGFGLFLIGVLAIGLSAHAAYWRELIYTA